VFPDTVRNGRAVDVFMWRGSPNPTNVQRVAAAIFGLFFFFLSVAMLSLGVDEPSGIIFVVALLGMFVGLRICRNAWPRKSAESAAPHESNRR